MSIICVHTCGCWWGCMLPVCHCGITSLVASVSTPNTAFTPYNFLLVFEIHHSCTELHYKL